MASKQNPSRRDLLMNGGALGAMAALSGRSQGQAQSGKGNGHPNVLFMLVDEMRFPPVYEAAAARQFHADYLHTQNALRETGTEFHRHYTASMACAPSRTSIFTGQYPSLHGVTQTTGAAKESDDPDTFWLARSSVPTMGDYFRAAGYRSFCKGKWHVSGADLQIPGTHDQIVSYDSSGDRDADREADYLAADRLDGYGFNGWIGPEPHGKAPLNTGSSPIGAKGRDQGFAAQSVELLNQLDQSQDDTPWFMVSSFVNPHDITLWGYAARETGLFDFAVEDVVPELSDLFEVEQFRRTLLDDLSRKPSCQESYRATYHEWMQGIPANDYFRFYYQLHKNVDAEMFKVYSALKQSRFFDNTIVVFTSDHGDLLGSHNYMHQKWYQTYEEALRVPLFISAPQSLPQGASIDSLTSHVDLLPTLLGLAGLNEPLLTRSVAPENTDTLPLVGRNLSRLVSGHTASVSNPIYFMTDDDPSRGLDQESQENIIGIPYDSVIQPNHIESVIVELDGEVWKYSRYFDNLQFWTNPEASKLEPPKDIVLNVEDPLIDVPGKTAVNAVRRVKFDPESEEFEMYNVTQDPMELENLVDSVVHAPIRQQLAALLDEQRSQKRLIPVSGNVPGQPTS